MNLFNRIISRIFSVKLSRVTTIDLTYKSFMTIAKVSDRVSPGDTIQVRDISGNIIVFAIRREQGEN